MESGAELVDSTYSKWGFVLGAFVNYEDYYSELTRLAVLPNVNGQKYTLGSSYTSREEQGEFILLSSRLDTEIQINVENGKYFVNPVTKDGLSSLFVNGSKVSQPRELTFGDKLSFGNDGSIIFKERYIPIARQIRIMMQKINEIIHPLTNLSKQNKLNSGPGQNSLIVSRILYYLPHSEIRSCRFVCQLWNEEALKFLLKRATLHLNLYSYCHYQESMELFRYSHEMRNISLQNSSFIIGLLGQTLKYESGMDLKLLDDLTTFISTFGSQTTQKLILRPMQNPAEYQLCLKILTILSQTLTHLVLELYGPYCLNWDLAPFPSNLAFPSLSTLTLSLTERFKREPSFQNAGFFLSFIPAICTLSCIQLNCEDSSLSHLVLELLSNLPASTLPNLNSIRVLAMHPAGLQSLLKMPQRFQSLEIVGLYYMQLEDYSILEELLWKHAPTLESLQFFICSVPVPPVPGILRINLPSFPKLLRLTIGWMPQGFLNCLCCPPVGDIYAMARIVFDFGTNGIVYGEHFPVLESLTLWPMGFGKIESMELYGRNKSTVAEIRDNSLSYYALFFPGIVPGFEGETEIVTSIQVLDILTQVEIEGQVGRKSLFSLDEVARIAKMFPNLRDKDWARKACLEHGRIEPELFKRVSDSVRKVLGQVKQNLDDNWF